MSWLTTIALVALAAGFIRRQIHRAVHKDLGLPDPGATGACAEMKDHPRFNRWASVVYALVVVAVVFSPLFAEYQCVVDNATVYMTDDGHHFQPIQWVALERSDRRFVKIYDSWHGIDKDCLVQVLSGDKVRTLRYTIAWQWPQNPADYYHFQSIGLVPDDTSQIKAELRHSFFAFNVQHEAEIKTTLAVVDLTKQDDWNAFRNSLEEQIQASVPHPEGTTLSIKTFSIDQF